MQNFWSVIYQLILGDRTGGGAPVQQGVPGIPAVPLLQPHFIACRKRASNSHASGQIQRAQSQKGRYVFNCFKFSFRKPENIEILEMNTVSLESIGAKAKAAESSRRIQDFIEQNK